MKHRSLNAVENTEAIVERLSQPLFGKQRKLLSFLEIAFWPGDRSASMEHQR